MNSLTSASAPTREKRGIFFETNRAIFLFLFKLAGWRVKGEFPPDKKLVVIAAPHTSNWDLPFMLAVALYYRVNLRWMGKDALFKGLFGGLMHALGGIPIDRSKSNNVVDQMIDIYGDADDLVVAIPPEGTRSKVRYWKTGFYNIAHGAGVRIALGYLDYKNKHGGVGAVLETTGDYEADLKIIKDFYSGITAKFEDKSQN